MSLYTTMFLWLIIEGVTLFLVLLIALWRRSWRSLLFALIGLLLSLMVAIPLYVVMVGFNYLSWLVKGFYFLGDFYTTPELMIVATPSLCALIGAWRGGLQTRKQ